MPRPWFDASPPGGRHGPHGEIAPEEELYGLLKIGDQFDLVQLEANFVEEAHGALATHPLIAKSNLEALSRVELLLRKGWHGLSDQPNV